MIYLKCPKRYEEWAWNCIEYLGIDSLYGDIYIKTDKNLKGAHGLAWGDSSEAELTISTHKKTNDTIRKIRGSIAHELVHAKQYLTRQLESNYGPQRKGSSLMSTRFKGRVYSHKKMQPWETEAFKLEKEMMEFFFPNKRYDPYE